MRKTHPNTKHKDTMHESFNGHPSPTTRSPGLQERTNAMWKNVDHELSAIDDIETIPFDLPEDIQNDRKQDPTHGRNIPVIETAGYPIMNSKARERRRMKLEDEHKYQTRHAISNIDRGHEEECIYTGFYETNYLAPKENLTSNRQITCFTILNKHYAMNSDSSSGHENCDDVEEIPRSDTEWYTRTGNGDVATEHAIEPEKRTIWIYSFKNKPSLRTEAEYELIDIPSVSASECSMELGEEAAIYEKGANTSPAVRVATPIPSSYVPRLDLSKGSTLPTVTEITEAKSDDEKSTKAFVRKKPKNSWFAFNDIPPSRLTAHSHQERDKPSEFKWAPSSARERRRMTLYGEDLKASHHEKAVRTVETSTEILPENILGTKRSVSSQTRAVEIVPLIHDDSKSHRTPRSATTADLHEGVNVEIHEWQRGANVHSSPMISSLHKRNTEDTLEEVKSTEISTEKINQDDIRPETSNQLVQSVHILTEEGDVATPIPNGRFKKLHIKVSPNAKHMDTGPIENPESDDWITERKNEFSNSCDNIHLQVDNAGTRLLIRNQLLLKPSRWDDYTPIADSLPSLQITIGDSDSEDDDTWWRRVLNCLLCRKSNLY